MFLQFPYDYPSFIFLLNSVTLIYTIKSSNISLVNISLLPSYRSLYLYSNKMLHSISVIQIPTLCYSFVYLYSKHSPKDIVLLASTTYLIELTHTNHAHGEIIYIYKCNYSNCHAALSFFPRDCHYVLVLHHVRNFQS